MRSIIDFLKRLLTNESGSVPQQQMQDDSPMCAVVEALFADHKEPWKLPHERKHLSSYEQQTWNDALRKNTHRLSVNVHKLGDMEHHK